MTISLPPAAAPGVRLLRPEDPAWDLAIAGARPTVFHRAGYHRYRAGYREGAPYLAVVGDSAAGVAWPYLLREVGAGLDGQVLTDATSVYGYPGPLVWGYRSDEEQVQEALGAIAETWRTQGVVSAFTRFNPLIRNDLLLVSSPSWAAAGSPGVLSRGSTVSIDLSREAEEMRAGYRRDLARQIRRGRAAGLRTVVDADWRYLPAFAEQYRETMVRLGAAPFYYFSLADLERLRDCLPDATHLLVTLLGDDLAAGGIFLDSGDTLDWHLSSTKAELMVYSPSKVLVEDAALWARSRGFVTMHLGGGLGGREDSLFFFKCGFSRQTHPFTVGEWIVDSDAYLRLVDERVSTLPPGDRLHPGFFPAYRASAVRDVD